MIIDYAHKNTTRLFFRACSRSNMFEKLSRGSMEVWKKEQINIL